MAEYPHPAKRSNHFTQQDYLKSGSSTDCTGLIPTAPLNDNEYDSYQEIYNFLPPLLNENTDS